MRLLLLTSALTTGCLLPLSDDGPTVPGTYVSTIPTGVPAFIQAGPTALPAFVGVTERLPDSEPVVRITSMADYETTFGGQPDDGEPFVLAPSVALYFDNGGTEALIVPVGTYDDGAPTGADLAGGLAILAASDASPTLLLVPDAANALAPGELSALQGILLQHCADFGRFCLLDLAQADVLSDAVDGFRATLPLDGVSFGAAYVPWVEVSGAALPPSGVIAGVMARVDAQRGVWTPPANEAVRGVTGLTHAVDDQAQEGLQVDPVRGLSVNPLRTFPTQGIRVWGARTLAGNDNEWRYVNVRRLALWLEHSIDDGTTWAVFEPNDEPMWAQVRALVENHLTELWRDGAFLGDTPEDAFFVRAGLGTTMTAEDIARGRLIIDVGFAPLRPAEFVLLRIEHQMQSASP